MTSMYKLFLIILATAAVIAFLTLNTDKQSRHTNYIIACQIGWASALLEYSKHLPNSVVGDVDDLSKKRCAEAIK